MLWRPSHWKTLKKNAAFLHFNFCEYSKLRLRFFPLCFCDIPAWEFGCNGSSSAVSSPVHVYKYHERLIKESCGLQVKARQKGHILRSWRSLTDWKLVPTCWLCDSWSNVNYQDCAIMNGHKKSKTSLSIDTAWLQRRTLAPELHCTIPNSVAMELISGKNNLRG